MTFIDGSIDDDDVSDDDEKARFQYIQCTEISLAWNLLGSTPKELLVQTVHPHCIAIQTPVKKRTRGMRFTLKKSVRKPFLKGALQFVHSPVPPSWAVFMYLQAFCCVHHSMQDPGFEAQNILADIPPVENKGGAQSTRCKIL
jgi:hypothetical protein